MKKIRNIILIALSLGLVLTGCNDKGGKTTVDNRADVEGIYPVMVSVSGLIDIPIIPANLELTKEGASNLKISATIAGVSGLDAISLNLVLSDLKEYSDEEGQAVTGYMFKIVDQEFAISEVITVSMNGTGKYDGYDGIVYKTETSEFISMEISGSLADTLTVEVKVETAAASE